MTTIAWDEKPFDLTEEPGSTTSFWGVVLFIVTEGTLFALLLLSYLYLRFQNTRVWPPTGIEPPTLPLPGAMTVVLLGSSIPMFLATRALHRNESVARIRAWLALSMLLGLGFLALQGVEYADKLDHFRPTTNVYGSLFFTITGFHAVHVLGGLVLTGWSIFRAGAVVRERESATIEVAALYWHFVDVVWIAIFVTIYVGAAR